MKIKKGFIVKSITNGNVKFDRLLPRELHFVSQIIQDSDDQSCEVKMTTFENEEDFVLRKF